MFITIMLPLLYRFQHESMESDNKKNLWEKYIGKETYSIKKNYIFSNFVSLTSGNYYFKNVQFTDFGKTIIKVDNINSNVLFELVLLNNLQTNDNSIVVANCLSFVMFQVNCIELTTKYIFDTNTSTKQESELCSILNIANTNYSFVSKSKNVTFENINFSHSNDLIYYIGAKDSNTYNNCKYMSLDSVQASCILNLQYGSGIFQNSILKNVSIDTVFSLIIFHLNLSYTNFINCQWNKFCEDGRTKSEIFGVNNYFNIANETIIKSIPSSVGTNGQETSLSFSIPSPNFKYYTYDLKDDLARYRRYGIKPCKV